MFFYIRFQLKETIVTKKKVINVIPGQSITHGNGKNDVIIITLCCRT